LIRPFKETKQVPDSKYEQLNGHLSHKTYGLISNPPHSCYLPIITEQNPNIKNYI